MQQILSTHHSHTQGDNHRLRGISHFSLPDLLADGRILALNVDTHTLLLLSDGPRLVLDEQLSANEVRILLPLLESFPHYSPYEVLLSSLESESVTGAGLARCRQRLQEAQTLGTWPQELRPLRRALSSLRQKLHPFALEISTIREQGYSLTSVATLSQPLAHA